MPRQARVHHCQDRGHRPAAPPSPGKCQVDMGHSALAHHGSKTPASIWLREYPQWFQSQMTHFTLISYKNNANFDLRFHYHFSSQCICSKHRWPSKLEYTHLYNLMQSKCSSGLTSVFTQNIMLSLVFSCSLLRPYLQLFPKCSHLHTHKGGRILKSPDHNVVLYSTTTMTSIKIDFMAEQLNWIALYWTGFS